MATIPSSNATATRYAANGKDIWVPSQTINNIAVGGGALPEALRGTYGKIFTTRPATATANDLFYGTDPDVGSATAGHVVLQYYNSGSAQWVTILDTSADHIYHTVAQNGETFEEAAQRELYQKGRIGDRVLVTDAAVSPTEYEVFTMVGGDSTTTTSAVVLPETTETAAEISVENSNSKPYLGLNVETSLAGLSDAVVNTTDFCRYAVTVATQPTVQADINVGVVTGQGVPPVLTNYTGQLKFTCVVSCISANYRSVGVITCMVIDGDIDPESMTLTDYYVGPSQTWADDPAHSGASATSGPGQFDVFNLDFTINAGELVVTIPSAVSTDVEDNTTVKVKVQW